MISPIRENRQHVAGQSMDEALTTFSVEKILLHFVIVGLAIAMIFVEWIKEFLPINLSPMPITVVGILIIIFSTVNIIINVSTAIKLRQGRDGEREVGDLLENLRTDGAFVLHDVVAKVKGSVFNIDHVVIAPQGVFSIETKTWSKKNPKSRITSVNNHIYLDGKIIRDEPLQQSLAQSSWLKDLIFQSTGKHFTVNAVLVFPGWFIEPDATQVAQSMNVLLLNPKALVSRISGMNKILSQEDVNMINFHLRQYVENIASSIEGDVNDLFNSKQS